MDLPVDLELPIPDVPPPRHHHLPLADAYAINEAMREGVVFDEAYFEASLARKVRVPFVMD